jgi:hypothetical protein
MHTTEQSSGQINGRDTISTVAPITRILATTSVHQIKGSNGDPVSLDSAVISGKGGVFE